MDKDLIMKISGFTDANTINYKGILEETHKTFRFYRAPEVILLSKISIKSDIW